jgi:hypothetical protein
LNTEDFLGYDLKELLNLMNLNIKQDIV